MFFEQPDCLTVKQADDAVHELQPLRRTQGPPSGQHLVVDLLKPQPRQLAKHIQGIQYLL